MSDRAAGADLVVGVIGGLGPAATVDFMARVLELTPAGTEQEHLRLLVDQNPKVPNRQEAILGGSDSPAPMLAAMAAGLEAAGADFIVMPCNTAHAFESDIRNAIGVPFVSIVAATVDSVPEGLTSVGVLETPAGRRTQLYRRALGATARRCVELDASGCEELLRVAYAVKSGDCGREVRRSIRSLADRLVADGAQAIIAGCTEVPMILADDEAGVPLISCTDALARRSIALARRQTPLPVHERS